MTHPAGRSPGPTPESGTTEPAELAARIADIVEPAGLTIAVAESLTGGMVSSALAEAPNSSRWFRGAVVAYAGEVKHDLLGVPPGPVVSRRAAAAMADAVRELLNADLAVSLTGAGGPAGQDGQPPGTVFIGWSDGLHTLVEHHYFGNGDDAADPAAVCARTVVEALRLLLERLCEPAAGRSVR